MMYSSSSDSSSSSGEEDEEIVTIKKQKRLKLKPSTIKRHTDMSRLIQELPLTNS